MNIRTRLTQLEKRSNEQPFNTPAIIEIYGTRTDGTKYLHERREKVTDADGGERWVTVNPVAIISIPDNGRDVQA